MDNLTHTLVGAALSEAGLKRATPLGAATLLIAANIPDVDIVYGVLGPVAYFQGHRGITHSLVGFPVVAALLAASIYLWSRFTLRWDPTMPRARFGPLLALSLIGITTHPLLDYTNSYGWRPFLPWNPEWYYLDIAFVADPWIWIGMGGAVFLSTSQTRNRVLGWAILFLVATTVILVARVGATAKILWLALAAIFLLVKLTRQLDERWGRLVNLGAIAALLVYFGALAVLHAAAVFKAAEFANVALAANEQVIEVSALPTETNPLRWRMVVATEKAFYLSDLYLYGGREPVLQRFDRETGDHAAIHAACAAEPATTFLRFARFPVISARSVNDETVVDIGDLRFDDLTSRFHIRVRLDASLKPVGSS